MNIPTVQNSMAKQAATQWWRQVVPALAAGTAALHNSSLFLLGSVVAGGVGIGALGAHITAHGKQDEDTVKKEYENERLKADIGYVSSRLEDEYNRSKTAVKPKAARVLNV